MSTDFSHLEQLQITTDTLYHRKMHEITINGRSPTLHLAPATEATPAYFNSLLKRSHRNQKTAQAGGVNTEMLDESRSEDMILYPKHIVKGWDDMIDAKGKDVKFSKESCRDFIDALPGWIFDNVRGDAGNPINFVDGAIDVEATAKN